MKIIFQILAYCFISIIVLSINLYAQRDKIEFENLTIDQGFTGSLTHQIIQDSEGFIWLATFNGLNRYDGYQVKVFRYNPQDTTSLSNNTCWAICEDKSGYLWIGTSDGLNMFDKSTETFIRYQHNPADSTTLSSEWVKKIYEDTDGELWIGTYNGLNKFDKKKKKFLRYFNYPDDPSNVRQGVRQNIINTIFEDKSGTLWIGTSGGLSKFDKKYGRFTRFGHNPKDPFSIISNAITSIYEDTRGNLWIGTNDGLNKFNKEKGHFYRYARNLADPESLSDNYIYSILEDKSGVLWFGTRYVGLNRFDAQRNRFVSYRNNVNDPTSLGDNFAVSIFEDRSGVIWIGGETGFSKIVKEKQQFVKYKQDPNNPASLNVNQIGSIYVDRSGVIWVGADGGLYKFDKEGQQFVSYFELESIGIKSRSIFSSIIEDKSGFLWAGTYDEGIFKFDRTSGNFTRYLHDPDNPSSLSTNSINSVLEDESGTIWIGTHGGGLNRFDRSTEKFTRYIFKLKDSSSISHNRVSQVYKDKSGTLWIGTFQGLNQFDKETEKFTRYHHNPHDRGSLSSNTVMSISEDRHGTLWIGTLGGGLNKFDRKKGIFIHYGEAEGLPSESVGGGVFEDNQGNLWMGTLKGISMFDQRNETFRNYGTSDGIPSNMFAYYKSDNGEIYFGTKNSIVVFHPDSLKDNTHIPPVVITDFRLFNNSVPIGTDTANGRVILSKSILKTKEIELTYKDYIISFEFSALDFRSPEKNKYAYMMEGFDKDWTYTDSKKRFATYTNLDPGEYIFRVKGSNNDGIWNEQGASLKILITPPFWATWWAYTIYILFGISLIYILRRYELNRIHYKNQVKLDEVIMKEKDETDRLKSSFFANISHEFRTPLTLILGPADNIKPDSSPEEVQKQTGLIKRNAQRLMNLINQLLDLSKLEAGKLEIKASKNNIVSFLKGIVMSFESLAEKKDIALNVFSDKDEIELFFDKDMMMKILSNILSNAFKFTPEGGEISVALTLIPTPKGRGMSDLSAIALAKAEGQGESKVQISVKDTGIGISEDELPKLFDRFYQVDSSQTREYEGSGLGLALTKELVELHQGNIIVKSKVGEGSEFIVEFPYGKDHLSPDQIVESESFVDNVFIDESVYKKKTDLIIDDYGHDLREDKKLILLVEDNSDVREYIKDIIRDQYRVEEAANGQQGLNKAKELMPDLIVSDVMMPEMNGVEFCRIIKTEFLTCHIPVILLTAKTTMESKIEGLESGADSYLFKPFDSKELLVRIKNLLDQRKLLKEKFSKDINPIPDKITTNKLDDEFLRNVFASVEKHLGDEKFDSDLLAQDLFMSRMKLHRKLNAVTGQGPGEFIRAYKLKRAAQMLLEKKLSVTQIAYEVGYNSPSHFSKAFIKFFNCNPSDYTT